MGKVEREVLPVVRFEVVDRMLEGFPCGQGLTRPLFDQTRFSAQDVEVSESMGRVVAHDTLTLINQRHGKAGHLAAYGVPTDAEGESIRQIMSPFLGRHFLCEPA